MVDIDPATGLGDLEDLSPLLEPSLFGEIPRPPWHSAEPLDTTGRQHPRPACPPLAFTPLPQPGAAAHPDVAVFGGEGLNLTQGDIPGR